MVLSFYFDLLSQPCRSLYLFMKGAGVDFETKDVDLFKGEQLKPEFLKKNPFHTVPIIDDDGFIVVESIAIMRYIAVKSNLADHWYPRADPKKQARADEFLHWQHTSVRKPSSDIFLALFKSKVGFGTKEPLDEPKLKASKEDLEKTVQHIADYFLQDKKFICGDEVSVADIVGIMELMQLYGVEEDGLFTKNAKVKAWVDRTKEKLQPHFDDSLKKLDHLRKMYAEAK